MGSPAWVNAVRAGCQNERREESCSFWTDSRDCMVETVAAINDALGKKFATANNA
jgi:hypothetical protein